MHSEDDDKRLDDSVESDERREFIRKSAYVAPTLTLLGTLANLNSASAQSGDPEPPPPPT